MTGTKVRIPGTLGATVTVGPEDSADTIRQKWHDKTGTPMTDADLVYVQSQVPRASTSEVGRKPSLGLHRPADVYRSHRGDMMGERDDVPQRDYDRYTLDPRIVEDLLTAQKARRGFERPPELPDRVCGRYSNRFAALLLSASARGGNHIHTLADVAQTLYDLKHANNDTRSVRARDIAACLLSAREIAELRFKNPADAADKILERLVDMTDGVPTHTRTLIPYGWGGENGKAGHAMLLEFVPERGPNGYADPPCFTIRIYNSGAGLKLYHIPGPGRGSNQQFETMFEINGCRLGEGKDMINHEALVRILALKSGNEAEGAAAAYRWACRRGKQNLGGTGVTAKPQQYRDCSLKSIIEFLRHNLPEDDFELLYACMFANAAEDVSTSDTTMRDKLLAEMQLHLNAYARAEKLAQQHMNAVSTYQGEPWFLGQMEPDEAARQFAQSKTGCGICITTRGKAHLVLPNGHTRELRKTPAGYAFQSQTFDSLEDVVTHIKRVGEVHAKACESMENDRRFAMNVTNAEEAADCLIKRGREFVIYPSSNLGFVLHYKGFVEAPIRIVSNEKGRLCFQLMRTTPFLLAELAHVANGVENKVIGPRMFGAANVL